MDAIEEQSNTSLAPVMRWEEICAAYWDEWVLLCDVVDAPDGSIQTARVLDHDRSLTKAHAKVKGMNPETKPETVLIQTAGRPLLFPRIVMTDELRARRPPRIEMMTDEMRELMRRPR